MDNGGFVYYFEYKKIIKSIYLFEVNNGIATCYYELLSNDIEDDDKTILFLIDVPIMEKEGIEFHKKILQKNSRNIYKY